MARRPSPFELMSLHESGLVNVQCFTSNRAATPICHQTGGGQCTRQAVERLEMKPMATTPPTILAKYLRALKRDRMAKLGLKP